MKLLEIQAKDIVIVLEIGIKELEQIKLALDCAELSTKTEEEKEAVNTLTKSVYPFILKVVEDVKGKQDGT